MSSTTLTAGDVGADQESRLEAATKTITSACGWSAGAALLPIPILDLAALAAVQAQLCNDIAKIYGHTFSSEASKSIVSVLWGTLVPGALGSGLKSIPGLGYIFGSVAFGAFGAASTYAVGKVMVRHFENGGTALSFDASKVGDDLKKEFSNISKNKPAA